MIFDSDLQVRAWKVFLGDRIGRDVTDDEFMDEWDLDPQVRAIVTKTVRESLVAPVIYVQNKFRDAYDEVEDSIPTHVTHGAPPSGSTHTKTLPPTLL